MTDQAVLLPFHRRYRPRSFKDLVGHRSVKDVVQGALASERSSGCFLFHGPFGTGKTSLMRLMSAALLCTKREEGQMDPCGVCPACVEVFSGSEEALDYREADCGNNTGADDARALAGWLAQQPMRGARRIVALDEVHKLSNAASSVLLKLVEEPPEHVLFLMATTDPEKILPTIRSRAITLQLRPLTTDDVQARLVEVAEAEGVQAGPEVLREIASSTGGHLRDALQELQRLALLDRPVDLEDVWAASAKLPPRQAGRLCKAVLDGDAVGVLEQARALLSDGLLATDVVLGMEQLFRDCFVLAQLEKGADHLVALPAELLPKFKALAKVVPPGRWRQLLALTEPVVKRLGIHAGREALLLDLWLLELLQPPLEAAPPARAAAPTEAAAAPAAPAAEPAAAKPRKAPAAPSEPPEIPMEPAPPAVKPVVAGDAAALIGCLRNRNHQQALKRAVRFEIEPEAVVVQPSTERHHQALLEAAEEIAEAFTAMLQRPVELRLEAG